MEELRLNKYLSDAGVCSRREADRLIEQGKVLVDGIPAVMGQKVHKSQKIKVQGQEVNPVKERILLAFYKPRGIVCTTGTKDRAKNVVEYMNYGKRIYPVGRLDKESEGLLLMTNKGDLVNPLLKGSNYHEKQYVVTVNKPITDSFLQAMKSGVPILDTITRPCKVWKKGEKSFEIVLTQGLNRQIRRMCDYLGYKVVELKRIRIMNIRLGNLKVGEYRSLTKKEEKELFSQLGITGNDKKETGEGDWQDGEK